MRFIRLVIATLMAAALGAVLGRLAAGLRREAQGGEAMAFETATLAPSPQELVPGLVAALRATDTPWSALHVPPWLAAFVVNFAMAALGRELGPLLKTFGFGGDEDEAPARPVDVWTVEARPTQSPVPPRPAQAQTSGGFTPTSSATTGTPPPPANGDHPGFQPFRA